MFNIDIDKERAKTIREYGREIAITILMGCVAYLFLSLAELNNFIRTDLARINLRATHALENSTRTVDEFILWQRMQVQAQENNKGNR